MTGWPGDRVAGWPGGRVAGWPGGRVAGWPGGRKRTRAPPTSCVRNACRGSELNEGAAARRPGSLQSTDARQPEGSRAGFRLVGLPRWRRARLVRPDRRRREDRLPEDRRSLCRDAAGDAQGVAGLQFRGQCRFLSRQSPRRRALRVPRQDPGRPARGAGPLEARHSRNRRRHSPDGKAAPEIDGFTGDQRVFLGWAQAWRGHAREDYLRKQVVTDPHSPRAFRVVGPTHNIDAWYDAFGVKPGDAYYVAPRTECGSGRKLISKPS